MARDQKTQEQLAELQRKLNELLEGLHAPIEQAHASSEDYHQSLKDIDKASKTVVSTFTAMTPAFMRAQAAAAANAAITVTSTVAELGLGAAITSASKAASDAVPFYKAWEEQIKNVKAAQEVEVAFQEEITNQQEEAYETLIHDAKEASDEIRLLGAELNIMEGWISKFRAEMDVTEGYIGQEEARGNNTSGTMLEREWEDARDGLLEAREKQAGLTDELNTYRLGLEATQKRLAEMAEAGTHATREEVFGAEATTEALGDVAIGFEEITVALPFVAKGLAVIVAEFTALYALAFSTVGKFNPGLMERFDYALDDMKASIGEALQPMIEGLIPIIRDFADWIHTNKDEIQEAIIPLKEFTEAIIILGIEAAKFAAMLGMNTKAGVPGSSTGLAARQSTMMGLSEASEQVQLKIGSQHSAAERTAQHTQNIQERMETLSGKIDIILEGIGASNRARLVGRGLATAASFAGRVLSFPISGGVGL